MLVMLYMYQIEGHRVDQNERTTDPLHGTRRLSLSFSENGHVCISNQTEYANPVLTRYLILYMYMALSLVDCAGLQIRVHNWKLFSYFSTKTYVVGTQKNRLNEMVLLSTQNIY